MKRFIATLLLSFSIPISAMAFQTTVWLSSNTNVAVSTTNLCMNGSGASARGVLHGVCINSASAGTVQVFNSSGTASNTITGLYSTATQVPCNFYDVVVSSGLSFNKNGTADISILYQCY